MDEQDSYSISLKEYLRLVSENARLREDNDLLTAELDECWKSWEEFGEGLASIPREPEGFGGDP